MEAVQIVLPEARLAECHRSLSKCQLLRLRIGLVSVRHWTDSARIALSALCSLVARMRFSGDVPFLRPAGGAGWRLYNVHFVPESPMRKWRNYTIFRFRAELSSSLPAQELTPQKLHAELPSSLAMEQASGAQYTSGSWDGNFYLRVVFLGLVCYSRCPSSTTLRGRWYRSAASGPCLLSGQVRLHFEVNPEGHVAVKLVFVLTSDFSRFWLSRFFLTKHREYASLGSTCSMAWLVDASRRRGA